MNKTCEIKKEYIYLSYTKTKYLEIMKTEKIQALRNEMKMIQEKFLNREILTEREKQLSEIQGSYGIVEGSKEAFKKGF